MDDWARKAVEKMLVRCAQSVARECEDIARRLRLWVR